VNISEESLRDKKQSLELASTFGEKIPIGVFYKQDEKTSEDREIVLNAGSLASAPVVLVETLGILSQFQ